MDRKQLREHKFKGDTFNPKSIRDQVDALDNRNEKDKSVQYLAKSVYCTQFWKHIEKLAPNAESNVLDMNRIEVNKIKPALSAYLANLYPKRMKVILGPGTLSTGNPKKAEILMNHWKNRPVMRQRGMLAIRQALLYKGAGAKIGYDPINLKTRL